MTKNNAPVVTIKEEGNRFLFNIYSYRGHLIGIEEDPTCLQLFEMIDYGSPTDYFDWRSTQTGFGCLLDVYGKALLKNNEKYATYYKYMEEAEKTLSIQVKEWRNRHGK